MVVLLSTVRLVGSSRHAEVGWLDVTHSAPVNERGAIMKIAATDNYDIGNTKTFVIV